MSAPSPPPFLPDNPYTSNYCEENIYHLADIFLKQSSVTDVWDVFVVFISNEHKAVRRIVSVSCMEPTSVAPAGRSLEPKVCCIRR